MYNYGLLIALLTMVKGLVYLVAIMDWVSCRVLPWWLFNRLDSHFCVVAALGRCWPHQIFKTDQAALFASQAVTRVLKEAGVVISMDGKGR